MNQLAIDLLAQLAETPFADRLELAALSRQAPASVYQRVGRMAAAGWLESVPQASPLIAPTRRYALSADGVRVLARERGLGTAELLRTRPVSEQWRRLLLQRLETVATLYRLAASMARLEPALRWRWLRAAPMDALVELGDGRRLALVRQGMNLDRTAFAKRIRRLRDTPGFAAVLLISPDEVRLRQARRLAGGGPALTFLALEREVVQVDAETAIWRAPSGPARLTLREALTSLTPAPSSPHEPPLTRVSMPQPLDAQARAPGWLLPAVRARSEKRALDQIADWPWIRPPHLAASLNVGARRLAQLLQRLRELGLTTDAQQAARTRLTLSDQGLSYIARRDRASVGNMRRRWSSMPLEQSGALDWRKVSGTRSRQLLRHLEHTEAVHWFNAQLCAQARIDGLAVVQIDPPHRASRYFRYQEQLRSIHPDAFCWLGTEAGERAYFLEYERRAVRPATMETRLAPYLRYCATRRPLEDHGLLPSLLVVFEDDLAATHFLRVVERAIARADLALPVLVSDREALERAGPLGRAWRSVGCHGALRVF